MLQFILIILYYDDDEEEEIPWEVRCGDTIYKDFFSILQQAEQQSVASPLGWLMFAYLLLRVLYFYFWIKVE